jgi:hypothetical protein
MTRHALLSLTEMIISSGQVYLAVFLLFHNWLLFDQLAQLPNKGSAAGRSTGGKPTSWYPSQHKTNEDYSLLGVRGSVVG